MSKSNKQIKGGVKATKKAKQNVMNKSMPSKVTNASLGKKEKLLMSEVNTLKQQISQLKNLPDQHTLVLKEAAKHAVRIMDPHDYSPKVLADEYSTSPCCPVVPFEVSELNWKATTPSEISEDVQYLSFSRDPFAASIISTNDSDYAAGDQAYGLVSDVALQVDSFNDGNFGPLAGTIPGTADELLHGEILYPRISEQNASRIYYYMNKGDTFTLDGTVAGTSTASVFGVEFNVHFYGARSVIGTDFKDFAGTTPSPILFTYTAQSYGYFSFVVTSSAPASFAVGFSAQIVIGDQATALGVNLWFGQKPIPYLNEKIDSVDQIRVKAISVLISNISNKLTRNGNITGYQLPAGKMFYNFLGKNELSSQQGSVTMNAETGMYGFIKPTSFADFSYQPLQYEGVSMGNLDLLSDTLMFAIYAPEDGQGSGRSFRITHTVALDFKTGDTWFALHQTDINAAVIGELRNMVSKFVAFHENPLHLKDVKNFFKKVIDGAIKYGPPAIALVKGISTMLL